MEIVTGLVLIGLGGLVGYGLGREAGRAKGMEEGWNLARQALDALGEGGKLPDWEKKSETAG